MSDCKREGDKEGHFIRRSSKVKTWLVSKAVDSKLNCPPKLLVMSQDFFFYSFGRSATIRLCNTFSIEKILLVMRHKQILSQGLIKGCSLVCCDTRSQDIVCTSADVHPVLQGNLYRVFQRYRDIQSDSDNRNGLAPDSLEFVQVHCPQ